MFRPGAYESKPAKGCDAALRMRDKIARFMEGIAAENDAAHLPHQRYYMRGHEISDTFRMLAKNVRTIEPD